ncbi:MAG: phosphate/phosphite/phosphonate ABC transporter substrate-binding protein [Desulfobacteraceae bacterium]|jgi:phosphonate transport system substrate-binding protein
MKFRLFTLLLLPAAIFFAYGCGDDAKTVVVDFSNAVASEQAAEHSSESPSLKVAVGAMISPKETFSYYGQLLDYIGGQLGLEVQLIQRKTYAEINDLFGKGGIDLAFVCSGPYANGKEKYGFDLLSTPQIHGSHFYQSYLIVNRNSLFHSLKDLRGMAFAFTDPESNTGKLVPTYWLAKMGERPETFFSKTIYTHSHDNSIFAVAQGLVEGAAVDSLIWEYYHSKSPSFTSSTRIIKKSEPYGNPPLVTSRHLPPGLRERIREILFSMHSDPEGRNILKELMIDRFITPQEAWYAGIRKMVQELAVMGGEHAFSKPQK